MAICAWCRQEMAGDEGAKSCKVKKVGFPNGKSTLRIPFNSFSDDTTIRCGDCNVKYGGYHHPNCDIEECPKC